MRISLVVWALTVVHCLCSQTISNGAVSGLVTDEQSAFISGATVRLTDGATGGARVTVTNDAGRYSLNVPPGLYDLSISKTGFSVYQVNAQRVEVGLTLTVNAEMKVGSEHAVVEVRASPGSGLQSLNATVGSTLSGSYLLLLPNLGRDTSTLVTLQPAVAPSGAVAGLMNDQNTFQLDGGNITSDMDGNQIIYTTLFASNGAPTGVVPTPVESIDEFKVAISNQTADFGDSSGGQVQLVTKRGSKSFHGSAYEYYFATNIGAANTWRNNHTPGNGLPFTALPVTHRNRFGASTGGPLTGPIAGGRTYFFVNFEGYRFPNYGSYERLVPSALLRAGVIQLPNAAGQYVSYNLNPATVTVGGVNYAPASCAGGPCDPRGAGLNPVVRQIWSKYMPLPNDPLAGDHFNTQGYLSTLATPERSDSVVARVDHDFGPKWRLLASYRFTRYTQLNSAQVDIGGALPGDTFGVPAAYAPRVQLPSYLLAGLTTTISPNTTNDFRFNYTRNFWQWGTYGAPPQLPGLGGAVEIGGESLNALIPYNVDAGDIRQRFWDGQDKVFRDDLTMLRGNHILQVGGVYQRNFDFHMRNDNGSGAVNWNVYQVAAGAGISMPSAYIPAALPATQTNNWNSLYAQVLGLVSLPQTLYTRQGPNLSLQPLGSPAFDQSVIPFYYGYFSDIWRLNPRLALTYGLNYSVEMPPYERNGKQVEVVDQSGKLLNVADYLAARKEAALAGQVYNPSLGFATVSNVAGGMKYPYHPFYGGVSPRAAIAWMLDGKTVVRGGYSRIYGRLNGVALVLVPLLGTGLMQAVQCTGASRTGQCLGNAGVDPATAFRIGLDGNTAPLPPVTPTLSQPYFAGVNGNAPAGDGSALDPNFRPSRVDSFTLTVQREISAQQKLEVGYIRRVIRNTYTPVNLDSVPYMTTLNGQSFAQAFANLYTALTAGQTPSPQPFLEAALGGADSSYCRTAPSCTAAVAAAQATAITGTRVYDLWAALNRAPTWTLGRTMPSSTPAQVTSLILATSRGYANYNGAFVSWSARDWHGLTSQANLTWSRALGTTDVPQTRILYTPVDAWNLRTSYGSQPYDFKLLYNQVLVYQPPYFRGSRGIWGRLLGGWTFSPLFTAQSGAPLQVSMSQGAGSNCQSFGEINCSSGSTFENAAAAAPYTGGNGANYNVAVSGSSIGVNGNLANGGSGVNLFGSPAQVYSQFRRLILGIDTNAGGAGIIRGMPTWNLDLTVAKDIIVRREGGQGAMLLFQFTNVLNHMQPANPNLSLDSPQNFGVISAQSNTPRNLEFGLRIHF